MEEKEKMRIEEQQTEQEVEKEQPKEIEETMERMHSLILDLAGLMEKIERRRNKKHRERRVRLKGKYFSTEEETTTKALIAKIKGKIRRKEDNEGILSDIMENLQGEAMFQLNEQMMRNLTGRVEQLLEDMKKRFLQRPVQQEVCNFLQNMQQFKKETIEEDPEGTE